MMDFCDPLNFLLALQLLTWLTFVHLVLIITHNEQQCTGPVCCLTRASSVTGGSNPAVFPGTTPCCCHGCNSSFLPLSFSSLPRCSHIRWTDRSEGAGFLCTENVAGGRRHLQDGLEFIEIDLFCCLLQLTSQTYTSKSSFLLYPSFLSFLLSVPPCGPQAGPVFTVEQAADSTLTSVEDGRMGGWEAVEEGGLMRGTAAAGVCHCTFR